MNLRFWREWEDLILGGIGILVHVLAALVLFWLVPVVRNFLAGQGLFGISPKTYGRSWLIPWPHDGTDTTLLILIFVAFLAIVYAAALMPRFFRKETSTAPYA